MTTVLTNAQGGRTTLSGLMVIPDRSTLAPC